MRAVPAVRIARSLSLTVLVAVALCACDGPAAPTQVHDAPLPVMAGPSPEVASSPSSSRTAPPAHPTPSGTPTGTGPHAAPKPALVGRSSRAASNTSSDAGSASSAAPSSSARASSSPRTSSGAAASGSAMPKGDLPGWKQVIAEDFSRSAPLGSFGSAYPGWDGYDGNRDSSRNFGRPIAEQGVWNDTTTSSVQDGIYDCVVRTIGATPNVCALTPTATGRWWEGSLYGRYSVRFEVDPIPGYKIAWLLWPSSNRWSQGEIDFPEGDLDGTITGASHDVQGSPSIDRWFLDTHVGMSSWHTATIEWRPGSITFGLDGTTWRTTDPRALPSSPMRWALQAESRLSATPPKASATGHIRIDWLTEYRYQP